MLQSLRQHPSTCHLLTMKFQGGVSNVFTGIPIESDDRLNQEEWDALQQRLLEVEEYGEEALQARSQRSSGHIYSFWGAFIGMASASIGLAWLDSVPLLGTLASVFSSMLWSFATSFVSYICFRLCVIFGNKLLPSERVKFQHESDGEVAEEEPSEYFFCLGVFFGFCSMCMTHDILKGYPVRDILLLTGLPFASFAAVMIICAKRRYQMVHVQTSSQARPIDVIV